ncbi:hypothetical protein ACOMHN_010390 [Nucella lapillus]
MEPYQDEPLLSVVGAVAEGVDWISESSESVGESEIQIVASTSTVLADNGERSWCKCGNCQEWPGQREEEKVCCHSYDKVASMLEEDQSSASSTMKAFSATVCQGKKKSGTTKADVASVHGGEVTDHSMVGLQAGCLNIRGQHPNVLEEELARDDAPQCLMLACPCDIHNK